MSSLFGNLGGSTTTKPTLSLGTTNTGQSGGTGSSLFGAPFGQSMNNNANMNISQNTTNTAQPTTTSSAAPQIDIAHVRSTTKWDHLVPALAQEIENEDRSVLNQMNHCAEVANLIPTVVAAGQQIGPAIEYVNGKLEELELGLENDADAIVNLRDGAVKRDEAEVKCVFRAVDRFKMPRQYQIGHTAEMGANGSISLNGSTGLSGWWNQPHTLRGTRAASDGQQSVLVDEEVDNGAGGPKTLVELFNNRAEGFKKISEQHKQLLGEVEDFVGSLEEKVINKERDLNDRLNFGDRTEVRNEEERERQIQMLRYVFGEVQRELYEMADKVGTTRDSIVQLGLSG